jgi:glycolate oxidase
MPHVIPANIRELSRRLGGLTLHTEPQYTISYNFDATGIKGRCGGVIFPERITDLQRIVRAASDLGVSLYARGAGSGYSGGAVPLDGGVVISTERMARILDFDREAEEVEVESGVVNKELQDFLEPHGYFYPPDPASLKFSTLGGNIAENAGGPRAYKYGVTRRYVRSMTWITAEGEIVTTPACAAAALLIGAEGTLGIIYSARLSVLRLPERYVTVMLSAGGDRENMAAAAMLLAGGFCPSVLEFIDAKTMTCVMEYRRLGFLDAGASYLFIEIDGAGDEVAGQFDILREFCAKRNISLISARDEEEREALWELRRAISPSLARRGITKVNEDVSLPLGSLEEAVTVIGSLTGDLAIDGYVFGHCGDGNLHVNIMTDRRRKEEMQRVGIFVEKLFDWVAGVGGTLSGEHGIGITKSGYLDRIFSPDELSLQRSIKEAMDSTALLNPGKYFSK